MLGRGKKMQPGFADFPSLAQGFGFACREAISEAREFSKTHQVGFRQRCDTGVVVAFNCDKVIFVCNKNDIKSVIGKFMLHMPAPGNFQNIGL